MRYDLTDLEWSTIEPVLPKGRRGRQWQNNRRVMDGVFWVLRTGEGGADRLRPSSAPVAPCHHFGHDPFGLDALRMLQLFHQRRSQALESRAQLGKMRLHQLPSGPSDFDRGGGGDAAEP